MTDAGSTEGHDCRELLGILSDYLDGELDPSVCGHLEQHVSDCDRCARFLESLRRTVQYVRDVRPEKLPEDMKQEIVEAYRSMRL